MKQTIITLFLVHISFMSYSQDQRMNFEKGTFKEALVKAKKEGKLLFMDCYTSWCRPCKEIDKYVFTQEFVYAFFNENYINVKVNVEKGEGIELAQNYNVTSYPTLLVLNQNGEIVTRFEGVRSAKALVKKAKEVLKRNN
ncbi:thioredoxin domain-containing protein [Flavobacteriaceae bacterium F08102]|nr:thioredoxin domain-containing protein [Flavobacteriaceae bacterium F08102]